MLNRVDAMNLIWSMPSVEEQHVALHAFWKFCDSVCRPGRPCPECIYQNECAKRESEDE